MNQLKYSAATFYAFASAEELRAHLVFKEHRAQTLSRPAFQYGTG